MTDSIIQVRLSRRQALRRAAVAGVGVAGLALVGCGGADDDDAPAAGADDARPAADSQASGEAEQAQSQSLAAGQPADDGQEAETAPEEDAPEDATPEGADVPPAEEEAQAAPADEPPPDAGDDAPAPPAWEAITAAGPAPRRNPILAADEARRVVYLHGGRGADGPLDDLWEFDPAGQAWRAAPIDGARPPARFSHAAAVLGGRLVITTGQQTGFFSDVWAYDPPAGDWVQLAPDGAGPRDRYGVGFAHIPGDDRLILSHGFTTDGRFDDTWSWGGGGWLEDSPQGARPGERCLHACAYDPQTRALLLFGGQDNNRPALGDSWLLVDGAWHEVDAPGPSPRTFPGLIAVDGAAWLFGGSGEGQTHGDLWRFDFRDERWELQELDGAPPARHSPGIAALPAAREIYLFGGRGDAGDLDDLWRLRV